MDELGEANDDPASDFVWESLSVQFGTNYDLDRDELVPVVGIAHPEKEPEIHDLAHELGWIYIEQIREEIREMQEATMLSPREFVAVVVGAEYVEREAAHTMDISVGNYRGKQGTVAKKLEKAEATTSCMEQLRDSSVPSGLVHDSVEE